MSFWGYTPGPTIGKAEVDHSGKVMSACYIPPLSSDNFPLNLLFAGTLQGQD